MNRFKTHSKAEVIFSGFWGFHASQRNSHGWPPPVKIGLRYLSKLSHSYIHDFLPVLATQQLKTVLGQNGSCIHGLGAPNIYIAIQKVQLDEHSATLRQRFCCGTWHWLHMQRSGFTIPATSGTLLCVLLKFTLVMLSTFIFMYS